MTRILCRVTIGEFVATGCGQSKKKAKHSAAKVGTLMISYHQFNYINPSLICLLSTRKNKRCWPFVQLSLENKVFFSWSKDGLIQSKAILDKLIGAQNAGLTQPGQPVIPDLAQDIFSPYDDGIEVSRNLEVHMWGSQRCLFSFLIIFFFINNLSSPFWHHFLCIFFLLRILLYLDAY